MTRITIIRARKVIVAAAGYISGSHATDKTCDEIDRAIEGGRALFYLQRPSYRGIVWDYSYNAQVFIPDCGLFDILLEDGDLKYLKSKEGH